MVITKFYLFIITTRGFWRLWSDLMAEYFMAHMVQSILRISDHCQIYHFSLRICLWCMNCSFWSRSQCCWP